MSTRIHQNNVHEKSPQKRNSSGQKCPPEFVKSVHKNSPILSTRIRLLCPLECFHPYCTMKSYTKSIIRVILLFIFFTFHFYFVCKCFVLLYLQVTELGTAFWRKMLAKNILLKKVGRKSNWYFTRHFVLWKVKARQLGETRGCRVLGLISTKHLLKIGTATPSVGTILAKENTA